MFRLVLILAIVASTAAVAGEVQVKNCMSGNLIIMAFNDNDDIMLINASSTSLVRGQTDTLRCATDRCKLKTVGMAEKETLGTFGSAICVLPGSQYKPQAVSADYVDCIAPRC